MSAFKVDGTFTSAVLHGPARKSFPFDGDAATLIVEQDFMVAFANFTPLALNTPHATVTDAYLVKESPLQDLGGGIAQVTRTYAQIPAARDEHESFSAFIPGLWDTSAASPPYNQYWAGTGDGRDPDTRKVDSRLHYEYFLCASGQTYETPDAIPIIPAQVFTLVSNSNAIINYLLPEGAFWSDSIPTKEAWLAAIAAGDEYVAEASTRRRWMGNIYERVTRYVKAQ